MRKWSNYMDFISSFRKRNRNKIVRHRVVQLYMEEHKIKQILKRKLKATISFYLRYKIHLSKLRINSWKSIWFNSNRLLNKTIFRLNYLNFLKIRLKFNSIIITIKTQIILEQVQIPIIKSHLCITSIRKLLIEVIQIQLKKKKSSNIPIIKLTCLIVVVI